MSFRLYPPGTRKGNRYYVARCWVLGREHEFVCTDPAAGRPTTDARIAKRVAKDFIAETARQGRALPVGEPYTFAEAAGRYMAGRTLPKDEIRNIKLLIAGFGAKPIAEVRQADIDAAAQKRTHYAAASKNRHVYSPASAILHYAAANEWAPYRRIKRMRVPQAETRRPAPETERVLLANTSGTRRLILLVLFRQGWRIGETLGLRWEKINLGEGTADLYIRKIAKWKTLFLEEEVRAELANVENKRGRVFYWADPSGVRRWLATLCRRLGVRFTPHMARHEFASSRHEAGANARDLVDAGTWTSPESTQRYIRANADHVRALLNRRPGKTTGNAD